MTTFAIIVGACLATLALCALFARSEPPRVLRAPRVTSLDHALIALINDVARRPQIRRHVRVDDVKLNDRLRSQRISWI